MNSLSDTIRHTGDAVSLATILATLSAWLPPLAALVSLIWGVIRIYETQTVQSWLKVRHPQFCEDCIKKKFFHSTQDG